MTPEQALSILAQATGIVSATRDQHELIKQALETLKTLLSKTTNDHSQKTQKNVVAENFMTAGPV